MGHVYELIITSCPSFAEKQKVGGVSGNPSVTLHSNGELLGTSRGKRQGASLARRYSGVDNKHFITLVSMHIATIHCVLTLLRSLRCSSTSINHQAGEGTTRFGLRQLSTCLPPGVAPGAESVTDIICTRK